ncbi:MAG: DUF1707 SHOCT-like domain-containing protein [Acidimicrobiales bacterium]
MSPGADGDGRDKLRASDADREHVAGLLRRHAGEGRLSLDELSDRVGEAYGATTLGQLDALVSDLPPDPAVPGEAEPASLLAQWQRPEAFLPRRHSLYYAAMRYLIIDLLCIVIWAMTGASQGIYQGFWPAWVIVATVAAFGLKASRHLERQAERRELESERRRPLGQ